MASRNERRVDVALWVITGLTVGAIAVLSMLPEPPLPWDPRLFGRGGRALYMYHAIFYAFLTLTLLLVLVWRPERPHGPVPKAWMVVVGIIGAGVALEFVQVLTGRESSLLDALSNVVGATVAYGVWRTMGGPSATAGSE